jgi:hypothetical protein
MKHNTCHTKPRLPVSAGDSTQARHGPPSRDLERLLLAECHDLLVRMEYDEQEGFYYWPHIPLPYHPDEPAKCGICTSGAIHIARKFSGFVAGYEIGSDEPETLVGALAGGHDFAVVGPFIVGWWGWEYDQALDSPVLPRMVGITSGKFKSQTQWSVFAPYDFRRSRQQLGMLTSPTKPLLVLAGGKGVQGHE